MVQTRQQAKQEAETAHASPGGLKGFYKYVLEPLLTMTVTPAILMLLVYTNRHMDDPNIVDFPKFVDRLGGWKVLFAEIGNKFVPTSFGSTVIIGFILFEAFLAKLLPGRKMRSLPSPTGYVAEYHNNGLLCYLATMSTLAGLTIAMKTYLNKSPTIVIDRFDEVIGACNAVALVCCLFLYVKGRYFPNNSTDCLDSGHPIYDFLWGVELFPRLLGIDIKWFVNCRIGMTIWPLLVSLCWLHSFEAFGWRPAIAVSSLLQLAYLTKFFLFEKTFFTTVDNAFDRGGYYICWGCLVFLTALYTFTGQYLALRQGPDLPQPVFAGLLLTGLFFIVTQRLAEADKATVRDSKGEKSIFNRKPEIIRAKYRQFDGKEVDSILLVSGFWAISRHYTYLAELGMALCWCLAGGFGSIFPYFYFIFLLILLVSRTLRDDIRCAEKYGSKWDEYVKRVPYRILPYVF